MKHLSSRVVFIGSLCSRRVSNAADRTARCLPNTEGKSSWLNAALISSQLNKASRDDRFMGPGSKICVVSKRYIFSSIAEAFRRKKTIKRENDEIDILSRYCNAMSLLGGPVAENLLLSSNSSLDSSSNSSLNSSLDSTLDSSSSSSSLDRSFNSSFKIAESLKTVSSRGFGVMEYKKIVEMLQMHIKSEFTDMSNENIKSICTNEYSMKQVDINSSLRLQLFQGYIESLSSAMKEGDVKVESIDQQAFYRLIDAFMLGSGDDRIREHLTIYGEKVSQYQFQSAFYTLFDPEIALATRCYLAQLTDKKMLKQETSAIKKFEKVYLLDTLELNTKVRCVFHWNDPNYKDFVLMSEETLMPVSELTESRIKYFKELSKLSSKFMADYLGQKRSRLVQSQERRESIVKGIFFFIGICILDGYIAVM